MEWGGTHKYSKEMTYSNMILCQIVAYVLMTCKIENLWLWSNISICGPAFEQLVI